MTDLTQLIKRYSARYDRKIKKVCAPLVDCLDIPVFTYSFIEADGRFGYLTNAVEFNEYYFHQKLHLHNPYCAHPNLFHSGHLLRPCSLDEETQKVLHKRFHADHFFLSLRTDGEMMESFVFANYDVDQTGSLPYLTRLELLTKFGHYFKREARDILGKMRADQFNIQKERGNDFLEIPPEVPLANKNPKIHSFLKQISGSLSRQELRCLGFFKQGKSAQATAAIMGISRRTVESYFESIKDKLGCNSKYDLLDY